MLAKERRDKIYALLRQNGAVTVAALVKQFDVSIETIRRDLLHMEGERLLQRVHGGAVSMGEMKRYQSLSYRNTESASEKHSLARAAVKLIKEGDVIGIDAGSTAAVFAEELQKNFSRLTVVTYSSDVFDILAKHEEFTVVLSGGHFNKTENAFCGRLAEETLSRLHVDKMFLCPSAISLQYGIFDFEPHLFGMQKKMMEMADSIIVLADSSKFEKRGVLKVDDMKPEYTFVTDGALPEALMKLYAENQMRVLRGM